MKCWHLVVLVAAATPLTVVAQDERQPAQPPKLDNYGDPLPPGAVLRLGTIRLQGGGFAWMPDGKSLVTAWGGKIWFWDVADGRPIKSIPAPFAGVWGANRDGTKLVGASADGHVFIYDLAAEKLVTPPDNLPRNRLYALAVAPDGTSFATGDPRAAVRVWDMTTGTQLLTLNVEEKSAREISLAYSPDSELLAVGTGRTIRIYDLDDVTNPTKIENAHGQETVALAFTPDGRRLISAGTSAYEHKTTPSGKRYVTNYCEVSIWDVVERKLLAKLEFPEQMRGGCAMTLGPDGNTLVTVHREKTYVWDLAERRIVRTLEGTKEQEWPAAMKVAIDPTGKYLAATFAERHVRLYDLATGKRLLAPEPRHGEYVTAVAWSGDGQSIATGCADGSVHVWDASSGQQRQALKHSARWVRSLVFTKDSAGLLVGAEDRDERELNFIGAVSLFNLADGELLYKKPLADRVMAGALSHDGKRLAIATGLGRFGFGADEPRDPAIYVFSVSSGEKLAELKGHQARVVGLAWSPDDSSLFAAAEDNTIRRFDVASERELSLLETPHERDYMGRTVKASLHEAAFLADDNTVLTNGAFTSDVHAWSLGTQEKKWTLQCAGEFVGGMAVSGDERVLALHERSDRRSVIGLWDIAAQTELMQIDLQNTRPYSMAFSSGDRRLVTGFEDGIALVWDVSAAWHKLDGVNGAANGATNPKGDKP